MTRFFRFTLSTEQPSTQYNIPHAISLFNFVSNFVSHFSFLLFVLAAVLTFLLHLLAFHSTIIHLFSLATGRDNFITIPWKWKQKLVYVRQKRGEKNSDGNGSSLLACTHTYTTTVTATTVTRNSINLLRNNFLPICCFYLLESFYTIFFLSFVRLFVRSMPKANFFFFVLYFHL